MRVTGTMVSVQKTGTRKCKKVRDTEAISVCTVVNARQRQMKQGMWEEEETTHPQQSLTVTAYNGKQRLTYCSRTMTSSALV